MDIPKSMEEPKKQDSSRQCRNCNFEFYCGKNV